jgi:hypothetical protein
MPLPEAIGSRAFRPVRIQNRCGINFKESYMSIISEVWSFLRVRKKFWLFPLVFIMVAFGILLVLAQSSAIAPFIYTLF